MILERPLAPPGPEPREDRLARLRHYLACAHDVRTPTAWIEGAAETLADDWERAPRQGGPG